MIFQEIMQIVHMNQLIGFLNQSFLALMCKTNIGGQGATSFGSNIYNYHISYLKSLKITNPYFYIIKHFPKRQQGKTPVKNH